MRYLRFESENFTLNDNYFLYLPFFRIVENTKTQQDSSNIEWKRNAQNQPNPIGNGDKKEEIIYQQNGDNKEEIIYQQDATLNMSRGRPNSSKATQQKTNNSDQPLGITDKHRMKVRPAPERPPTSPPIADKSDNNCSRAVKTSDGPSTASKSDGRNPSKADSAKKPSSSADANTRNRATTNHTGSSNVSTRK